MRLLLREAAYTKNQHHVTCSTSHPEVPSAQTSINLVRAIEYSVYRHMSRAFPEAVGPNIRFIAPRLNEVSSSNRSSKRSRVPFFFFPCDTPIEDASQENEHALKPMGGSLSKADVATGVSAIAPELQSSSISV